MRYFSCRIVFLLLLVSLLPNPTFGQAKHIQSALSFVGVKEKTGHNDGVAVEMFLHSVGLHKGDSWCGAFVGFNLTTAQVDLPKMRSGLAVNYITKTSIAAKDVLIGVKQVPDGSIFIFRHGTTIHGHTGFVLHWNKSSGSTVEGNTSSGTAGSQSDGDGVYKRTRYIQPANYFRIVYFTPVTYSKTSIQKPTQKNAK
jgi:hypothetical protein